jgi:hypothetical protein
MDNLIDKCQPQLVGIAEDSKGENCKRKSKGKHGPAKLQGAIEATRG